MRRIFTWRTEKYHSVDLKEIKKYAWLAKVFYSNLSNVPKEMIQPIYYVIIDTWRSKEHHFFTQEDYDKFLSSNDSKRLDWKLRRKINGIIINPFIGNYTEEEYL